MTKFCVIAGSYNRAWQDTQEAATEFAKGLGMAHFASKNKPATYYVVELKQVVEVGQPAVTVREPVSDDTAARETMSDAFRDVDAELDDDEESGKRKFPAKRRD